MKTKLLAGAIAGCLLVGNAFAEDKLTVFQQIQLPNGVVLGQTISTSGEVETKVIESEKNDVMTDVQRGQSLFPGFSGYDRNAFVQQLTSDLSGTERQRIESIHQRFERLGDSRISNALERVNQRYQGMKIFNLGSTDIDGGRSALELDTVWSTDQVAVLERAQNRAVGIRNRSMNYYEANKAMINGLRKALRNEIELSLAGGDEPTFLQTGLARAIEVIEDLNILDVTNAQIPTSVDNRAYYQLLQRQIDFLIQDVALNLDLGMNSQVYVDPADIDRGALELRFEEYSYAQLNWVNEYMAKSRIDSMGDQIVTGLGGSQKYLKTAEYTLINVAEDLFYSPWSKKYSFVIAELLEHYEALKKYNNGDRSEFYDNVEANRQTFNLIENALDSLNR